MSNVNVTKTDLQSALRKDSSRMSTNPSLYEEANFDTYEVSINVWLRLVDDVCGRVAYRALRGAIISYGLIEVIDTCCTTANRLIAGQDLQTELRGQYCWYLLREDEAETLQVLRFLKRFSPLEADLVAKRSIEAFLATNSRCAGTVEYVSDLGVSTLCNGKLRRVLTPPSYPRWLTDAIRAEIADILVFDDNWVEEFGGAEAAMQFNSGFTAGSTAEHHRFVVDKLNDLAAARCCYEHPMYPLRVNGAPPDGGQLLDEVVVTSVPKSYKASRIIAQVPTVLQKDLVGLGWLVERCMSRYPAIDIHDQSRNQELARLGSISRSFATIDLSSASDSISQVLADTVFPDWVMDVINKTNPKYLRVDNERRRRWIFQTSGNATTFSLETVFFYAVSCVATRTVACHFGAKRLKLKMPSVYGDDIICDVRAFDTLCDFLSILGFTVNDDKSFHNGTFRESCGVEYSLGLPLHSAYWPRKEVLDPRGKTDDKYTYLQSMIALQHKLFHYDSAEEYLLGWIRQYAQTLSVELTTSEPGSVEQDLWDFSPVPGIKVPPFRKIKPEDRVPECCLRECHSALITQDGPGYGRKKTLTESDRENLDMYYYVQYLKFGPRYESALDELLGVSKSRVEYQKSLGNTRLFWKRV